MSEDRQSVYVKNGATMFERHLQTVVQVIATAILLWGGSTLVELRTTLSVLAVNGNTLSLQLGKMEARTDRNSEDITKLREEQLQQRRR